MTLYTQEELDAAVAAEREACATIADTWAANTMGLPDIMRATPGSLILSRARSATQEEPTHE